MIVWNIVINYIQSLMDENIPYVPKKNYNRTFRINNFQKV